MTCSKKAVTCVGSDSCSRSVWVRTYSMFYQNDSPEVVRRRNGMEFHRNGFCREMKEESSVKVILLGYKVMEEKTKFTVYKILVKHAPDHSWIILRRYKDFSELHDKLKELFPEFNFSLPSKRWFNNFSAEFLEERKLGLQDFLQNLAGNKEVINSEAVRGFLCLDKPPSAFESLEKEGFCETSCCRQKMDSKCEIETLRNFLVHKELLISRPERKMISQRALDVLSENTSANGHFQTGQEYGEVEKDDPRRLNKSSELQFIRSYRACWYGPATDNAFTNIPKDEDLEENSKNFI